MDLYILRHGIAADREDPRYPKDEDRPLTNEGQKKTLRVARRMKLLAPNFDLVLSSPLARARQTAEITASVLGCKNKLKISPHLAPAGSKASLVQQLQMLRPRPKQVLLVGHEPYLSDFISTLLTGKSNVAIDLRKGGLCYLTIRALRYGRCATLEFLVSPKLVT